MCSLQISFRLALPSLKVPAYPACLGPPDEPNIRRIRYVAYDVYGRTSPCASITLASPVISGSCSVLFGFSVCLTPSLMLEPSHLAPGFSSWDSPCLPSLLYLLLTSAPDGALGLLSRTMT